MEKQGEGSIVNISSIGGVFANAGIAYSAAKAAVVAMTKNVAIQFAGKGISAMLFALALQSHRCFHQMRLQHLIRNS